MKALPVENVHPDATASLQAAGVTVSTRSGALDEPEVSEALVGVQLLGIGSATPVNASVLASATELITIGAFCIGTNQIDLAAAAKLCIGVFNAPFSNTGSVATGSTSLSVNLPRTQLEAGADPRRLAHLHANTPEVLAKVNIVLPAHDVNLEPQALSTRDHLGYLLTDAGTDYTPDVVQTLQRMPETVRQRVLS